MSLIRSLFVLVPSAVLQPFQSLTAMTQKSLQVSLVSEREVLAGSEREVLLSEFRKVLVSEFCQ